MSRAFVKEGAPEVPVVIPPRPPLPAGVANYVTPEGLAALRAEKAEIEAARTSLDVSSSRTSGDADPDAGREREILTGRLRDLVERIARSQLVEYASADRPEARFGATVTVRRGDGAERTFQIVGVDQATGEGLVAFTSPIARAVTGKAVGDAAVLDTPGGPRSLTVTAVSYGPS